MKRVFLKSFRSLALLSALAALWPAHARAADPTWTLVWNDEFSGTAGASPDSTRWTYDLGGGGWGNGELETYTSATANVYQDGGGHLVIQAADGAGNYTSARLKTFGLFDQAYGLVEASIQLPAGTAKGSGLWPAFWMLGSNINTATWPACGEIDIMENIGQYDTADDNEGHIHGPVAPGGGDYNGGDGVGTAYTLPAGEAINTGYHLYAVEWSPTSISYLLDGVVYQTLTAASLPGGGEWVFNHPFFILLNLALGGPVGGPVTCSFPQQMLVDYVRVYKLTDNGTSSYGGSAVSLPGTIPCANYDTYTDSADPGEPGEGFAYNALNTTQTNGVYRLGDAVSTEACSDTDGGYDCDYSSPGQWLQYTVNVTQAGSYNVSARVASAEQGGTFHLDVDGSAVTGELTCPNTGGWQAWQSVSAGGITLTAGTHEVLLVEDSMIPGGLGVCNFHELQFTLASTPTETATPTLSSTLSPPATPTATRTDTASPSPTDTLSATPTDTSTATPSATETATPTATLTSKSSGTATATSAETLSPSATASASTTAGPGLTYTGTASLTPSSGPSLTSSETLTPSPSPDTSVTDSRTPSATPSLTPSATPTPSATLTRTPTPSASSPSASATESATPKPGNGLLEIQQLAFSPDPLTGSQVKVYVRLQGSTDAVELRLYSQAFVRVADLVLYGNWEPGWNSRPLNLPALPNGLYYATATAPQGGYEAHLSKPARLMVLR